MRGSLIPDCIVTNLFHDCDKQTRSSYFATTSLDLSQYSTLNDSESQ